MIPISLRAARSAEPTARGVSALAFCAMAPCLLLLAAVIASAPRATASTDVVPNGETPSVELTDKQQGLIKTGPVRDYAFQIVKNTVGSIDFDQNREVQILTPYQGRIIAVDVGVGDTVKAGQTLLTISSPDLVQAETTLIQAAGVLDLANHTLNRARRLVSAGGGAQKDLEQALSDQQTAEGNFNAARAALLFFGKTQADSDRIASDRRVDATLAIKSPIDGVVTARAAAPGLFLQAGGTPAPLTVADLSVKWLLASFTEADAAALHIGQDVYARVVPMPDHLLHGRVSVVGESIDPATRRFTVRAEIDDPQNVLRPGMFANFTIVTGPAIRAPAVPLSGVVRQGDGTMTAWTTTDHHRFTQRVLKLGLQQNGLDQVIDGLRSGDTVVTDGAVYLNNILEAPPSD